ncbi:MAG TPA: glycosyltransferase family 39 protein [Acidimicrobiia bacterium]|jgi:4-amino-4-deoxy-L-arabinose transferase-like glycosyltransferase|nr:glycosyltransferase family 39 protein [Acidimicrobiia bacterium]
MAGGAGERSDDSASRRGPRWFWWALTTVGVAALGTRVGYVLISRANRTFGGDSYFYHAGANLLASGHGFIEPFLYHNGQVAQAAEHPPLYLVYLSIPSALGMTSTLTHLLWSCVLGTATVVVVGLIGREVLGPRVGIIAAAIAALYPNVWVADGSLQAETAAMFMTALTVLFAYRYLRRPSWPWLAAAGAAAGAASLARSELILLVPFVVAPLALLTRTRSFRQQLEWLAAAGLATLIVIGPWIGYNLNRFRHPVYLSVQYPALLASANCDTTYYGQLLGYFSVACAAADATREHVAGDQSQQAIGFQHAAVTYVRHHEGRLPVVVAARLGRIVEAFRPGQNIRLREFLDGIESPVANAALVTYYALALLSVAGAVVLRRRRVTGYPLLAPIAVVLITVALSYGNTRFRAPAEVMLAVLAAVAIDALVSRFASARAGGGAVPAEPEPVGAAAPVGAGGPREP